MNTAPTPIPIPNTAKTASIVWWILSVVFFIGIFTSVFADFIGADTEDWMFALGFFCLILSVTSLFVAIMYTKRGKVAGAILRGENLLAHWTYTPEEWKRYAGKEHQETVSANRGLFFLVAGIAVIIGIIFIIGHSEDWGVFAVVILGIIAIAGGSAWLAVALSKRQNRKYLGEVFITKDALFINRVLHTWKGFGAALEGVAYETEGREIPVVIIEYSIPARYNRQSQTVRVPVPHGHEAEAEIIVQQLENRRKPNEKI
jgi:hypothetical protein